MGFYKWMATHGPGSVGATAKAMAMTFIKLKGIYPQATKDELLLLTLRQRYSEIELDNAKAERMINESNGNLADLTLQVALLENPLVRDPFSPKMLIEDPETYYLMIEVIEEVIIKYLPEEGVIERSPLESKPSGDINSDIEPSVIDQTPSGDTAGLAWTALMVAAHKGNTGTVKSLLNTNTSSVDEKDDNGETALMIAAREGHVEVVQVLLTKGANVIVQRMIGV